mmetsp:Transcript_1806/g.5017  ORF Transcript_1806/g.5017 Transcript_1806/m.5017 type:complete len:208 (-) Transcript_1806:65-688(-)
MKFFGSRMALASTLQIVLLGVAQSMSVPAQLRGHHSLEVENSLDSTLRQVFHTLFHMKDDQPMPGSGVVVQVSQENLEAFRETLSSGCNHQFGLILQGNTSLETFNAGSNTSTAEESCRALEGTVCSTEARATAHSVSGGRATNMATNVTGQGCFPRQCLDSSDLELVASFMRSQARTTIPGDDLHIELMVDCSSRGGSVVSVGSTA